MIKNFSPEPFEKLSPFLFTRVWTETWIFRLNAYIWKIRNIGIGYWVSCPVGQMRDLLGSSQHLGFGIYFKLCSKIRLFAM